MIATGHHARIVSTPAGPRLGRGVDAAKDQSYVLHVIEESVLARMLLPVGQLTKAEVRRLAMDLDLRTAQKPESQDVCFITNEHGRAAFLGQRIPLKPAAVVDRSGEQVGQVDSVEMVTIGQRKGLGLAGGTDPKYVVDVDVTAEGDRRVMVGEKADLVAPVTELESWRWVGEPVDGPLRFQCSAHGRVEPGRIEDGRRVVWKEPHRRIAAGQSVVGYDADDVVVGGGIAGRTPL
jgi:tRNA-specific 2-thiouridylase